MKLLITGDVGSIGSAINRHIADNCVVNVDKHTYAGSLESQKSFENYVRSVNHFYV